MTRGQLPNTPEPGPSAAPAGTVSIEHVYDGTCDACGDPATDHGWIMRPNYTTPAPSADITVERTGWCEQLSCQRDRARWAHVLDRQPPWEGHRD